MKLPNFKDPKFSRKRRMALSKRLRAYEDRALFDKAMEALWRKDASKLNAYLRSTRPLTGEQRGEIARFIDFLLRPKEAGRPADAVPPRREQFIRLFIQMVLKELDRRRKGTPNGRLRKGTLDEVMGEVGEVLCDELTAKEHELIFGAFGEKDESEPEGMKAIRDRINRQIGSSPKRRV